MASVADHCTQLSSAVQLLGGRSQDTCIVKADCNKVGLHSQVGQQVLNSTACKSRQQQCAMVLGGLQVFSNTVDTAVMACLCSFLH